MIYCVKPIENKLRFFFQIGRIYFDAKKECREDCYVGLPTYIPGKLIFSLITGNSAVLMRGGGNDTNEVY